MFARKKILAIVLCLLHLYPKAQDGAAVYKAGDNDYQCFRIPAIIKTNKGTLLAFAEARKNNCGDAGDIDIVVRRSADNGKTWGNLITVWDDGANTCGNPAPVMDERTGKIILLSTWNLGSDREHEIIDRTSKDTRRVFVLNSADDGQTWSEAKDITQDVKLASWTWYATGPCNGIQVKNRKFKNRLVIPCDHIEAGTKRYFSHVIYSDDGGENWKLGGSTPTDQVNESTVAELPGGVLMLNMRNYGKLRVRQVSTSADGGVSWSSVRSDTALTEPVCQGSLISYGGSRKPVLAFSNPASQKARENMTVRLSYNNGKTWSKRVVVHEGPSAYSNLVELSDGNLGCLYEAGKKSAYESIVFKELMVEGFGR